MKRILLISTIAVSLSLNSYAQLPKVESKPKRDFEMLGVKKMDVIQSINGTTVDSPAKAMEAYNAAKAAHTDQGSASAITLSRTSGTATLKDRFSKAQAEDITDENFPELIESFDYQNAEITDIVKAVSELTGKNFIIDAGVKGKITIIAPSRITVAEAYKAFLSALAINGFTIVPSGKFLKIRSARNAQRDSIETYAGEYYPNTDQMITRIIQLKHLSAAQVNKDLRILSSKDGEMSIYEPTNSIILSDYGANIDRVVKIISKLDQPGFEDQMEVVHVKHAKAKDMADLIDQILNKNDPNRAQKGARGGAFSSGIPRFGTPDTTRNTQQAYFMVIPDDRTNSLIVTGNVSGIKKIKKLISQLDFKIRPDEAGGVNVYYVKYGDAEKIAQTLSGIAKESTPKAGSVSSIPMGGGMPVEQQQVFGGDVKIVADKNTNSLVITASKQDYEVVLNILSKIDISRDQVYVEAIIMEMKLEDTTGWGIGYYKFDKESKGIGRAGFNGIDLQNFLSPTGGKGLILGFGSGDTMQINTGTQQIDIKDTLSFINFIKQNVRTNILSTPQLTVLDNETGEIEVGTKIPTSMGTATGANGITSSNVTFEDATIRLQIKPFISPSSETIRMEIDQNIKQASKTQPSAEALAKAAIILDTRKIKTHVVVNNKDTLVLGGLISDSDDETVTKVPILGDIPIIGWLFKSKSVSSRKNNLLVFLTPSILRSSSDNAKLLGKKMDERIDFIKATGGRDPYGAKMDEFQKKMSLNKETGSEPGNSKQTSPILPFEEEKPAEPQENLETPN